MIYNAEKRDISIAVGGDAMITRRMSSPSPTRGSSGNDGFHPEGSSSMSGSWEGPRMMDPGESGIRFCAE